MRKCCLFSYMFYISKLIENVVASQIVKHNDKNSVMERGSVGIQTTLQHQNGTSFNRFTVNQDHCKGTCLDLPDMTSAFDTIEHDKLLAYFSVYLGFGYNVSKFSKSYLSDRTQCVQINGIVCRTTKLICGVLLFKIWDSVCNTYKSVLNLHIQ